MKLALRFLGLAAPAAFVLAGPGERAAQACGGCFQPPPPPSQTTSDITDERMLLSVSPTQSTLYDQIRYAGSPASFAWVLPIRGGVTVGLSADVLFDSIDALTATQITAPPPSCPAAPSCFGGGCGSTNSFASSSPGGAQGAGAGTVTVTKQENVGPYDTVQLHATDSSALSNWLTQNGFVIPASETPVLDAYVSEGFDFLAMKLLPNQGVQSMRPVRVSSPGASLSLPLRMAAIGTGATVGITIWVVSDGRYEPQNFQTFRIQDSELVWDWAKSSSNYTTLRVQHEAALQQAGWEIESSIEVNEQTITNVILSGGTNITGYAFGGGVAPSDPSEDYLPVLAASPLDGGAAADGDAAPDASPIDAASNDGAVGGDAASGTGDGGQPGDGGGQAGAGGVDAGPTVIETAEQVRTDDIATLFAGLAGPNVRVTRFRSDIAHSAMTKDLVVQASLDQSELSNVRNLTRSVNETCPIYDGCNVVGTGTPAQSSASLSKSGCAASPAVAGASTGSGAVAGLIGLLVAARARRRRAAGRA